MEEGEKLWVLWKKKGKSDAKVHFIKKKNLVGPYLGIN